MKSNSNRSTKKVLLFLKTRTRVDSNHHLSKKKQKNLEKQCSTLQPYEKRTSVLQKNKEHLHKQLQEWHTVLPKNHSNTERKNNFTPCSAYEKKKQKLAPYHRKN